jgi:hypothetical protein
MIQYQVSIEVDKKGSCKIAAHKLTREDANPNEKMLVDVFEEHNQELMKRIVEEFKKTNGWKGEYKEMDENGEYQNPDKATNALLEDLEQDIIAEMHPPLEKPTKTQIAWNQAMQWVIDRLQTYRKE